MSSPQEFAQAVSKHTSARVQDGMVLVGDQDEVIVGLSRSRRYLVVICESTGQRLAIPAADWTQAADAAVRMLGINPTARAARAAARKSIDLMPNPGLLSAALFILSGVVSLMA